MPWQYFPVASKMIQSINAYCILYQRYTSQYCDNTTASALPLHIWPHCGFSSIRLMLTCRGRVQKWRVCLWVWVWAHIRSHSIVWCCAVFPRAKIRHIISSTWKIPAHWSKVTVESRHRCSCCFSTHTSKPVFYWSLSVCFSVVSFCFLNSVKICVIVVLYG